MIATDPIFFQDLYPAGSGRISTLRRGLREQQAWHWSGGSSGLRWVDRLAILHWGTAARMRVFHPKRRIVDVENGFTMGEPSLSTSSPRSQAVCAKLTGISQSAEVQMNTGCERSELTDPFQSGATQRPRANQKPPLDMNFIEDTYWRWQRNLPQRMIGQDPRWSMSGWKKSSQLFYACETWC